MISVVSGCGRSLHCMFYLQNWCRNSLDVILFSLGYGAVLLCSSVGGSGRGCGVVDLRGCSGESCVVYPRSTQGAANYAFYTSGIKKNRNLFRPKGNNSLRIYWHHYFGFEYSVRQFYSHLLTTLTPYKVPPNLLTSLCWL